jgi:hypothetical protein
MNDIDRDDPRWLRLLGGARTPADPAVLERASARIAADAEAPEWLGVLGGAQASADPLVLARARVRIEAGLRAEVPGWFAWLGTPAALVTACALFVCATGVSIALIRSDTPATHDTTLVSALIGDDGSYGMPSASAAMASNSGNANGTADSGAVSQ